MMGLLPEDCCRKRNARDVMVTGGVTDGCSDSEYHTSKSPLENEFKEYSGGTI
jgi:hypothetical protein